MKVFTFKKEINLNFEKILIFLLIFDLFLGGGGRVFTISNISVRQVLFSLILVVFLLGFLLKKTWIRINGSTIIIYLLFVNFTISMLIGFINGNDMGIILQDISPLLFFLMYFPFYNYFIIKNKSVIPIFQILKISGFLISLVTIIMYFLAQTGFFLTMYEYLGRNFGTEFMFRPNGGVFFKGMPFVMFTLFLCYTLLLNKQWKYNLIIFISCFTSILSSGTRGFIYTMIVGLIFISIVYWKQLFSFVGKKFIIVIPIGFFVVSKLQGIVSFERIEINSLTMDSGVELRLGFFSGVEDILKINPILGGGFGTAITNRDAHLEISFLDILMEQGLLGMTVWGALIFYIFYLFFKLIHLNAFKKDPMVLSLFVSYCSLLIFTNTNPFINNPIGISFIIILIVTLVQKINIQKQMLGPSVKTHL